MKEQLARDDQRMDEQIARDAEIARIHAEEELQMLIDGLDRSNEQIAKHLHDYEQSAAELTIEEKIEQINELVKYQDHHSKILKYQAQQSKPLSKKQQREFYISVLRSHMKISEEVSEEDLKEMMELVPVEKVYVEALQVKHPIIDWEIHTEGQRTYWKIVRLGGSTAVYQFFVDMLKHFDKEDLNQLWNLVKETISIRQATSDKEKELWVELKGLYEPDVNDQLDEFLQLVYFPTASEERFPLLRSSKTSDFLLEGLVAEIGLDDSIPTVIDDGYYDLEGDILYLEQLLNEDTSSNLSPSLLPKESSLLVLPLPDFKQICLKEVERFDPFLSLTQSGLPLIEKTFMIGVVAFYHHYSVSDRFLHLYQESPQF
nr:hypothetical protein [Tanacetum cinerariifolium]